MDDCMFQLVFDRSVITSIGPKNAMSKRLYDPKHPVSR
jgi:hypothetical protein